MKHKMPEVKILVILSLYIHTISNLQNAGTTLPPLSFIGVRAFTPLPEAVFLVPDWGLKLAPTPEPAPSPSQGL
jgi:hypothetical protein